MNTKQFKDAFKNSKFNMKMGLGPLLLAGLGFLALKSYYYGISDIMQSMWDTTPSNSTNCRAHSPLKSTDKDSISRFLSLNNQ